MTDDAAALGWPKLKYAQIERERAAGTRHAHGLADQRQRVVVLAVLQRDVAERDVGRRVGDRVEITSGLAADARVVASGGAFLADGDTVKVVQ